MQFIKELQKLFNDLFMPLIFRNSKSNEAPRRKRTGYQSGLKTNLDFGEHVVSPKPPSAYFTPPQADGVLKKHKVGIGDEVGIGDGHRGRVLIY